MGGLLPRFSSLLVSIHLKENQSVVDINYLLMTYNVKDKLRHLL